MKILHICIASYYTEGMTYQDNVLPDMNALDGHSVTIISNAQKYSDGIIVDTGKQDFFLANGIRLIRLPYYPFLGTLLGSKIKAFPGIYRYICETDPDVILYHGVGGMALRQAVRYKKQHSNVKLYIDSHEDFNNSATTWISRNIQHRLFHALITRHALRQTEKVLYLTKEVKFFLTSLYHIPEEKLEFYPLGGILSDAETIFTKKEEIRKDLCLPPDAIIMCHSGKIDRLKRTPELLRAFSQVPDSRFVLLIIGSLGEEVKDEIMSLCASDARIRYLGWKSGDKLLGYLCACDIYLQPGSQSATMQNAICCNCAIMLSPNPSHVDLFGEDIRNGYYVQTEEDIKKAFESISQNPEQLADMKAASHYQAETLLDYRKLAARIAQ